MAGTTIALPAGLHRRELVARVVVVVVDILVVVVVAEVRRRLRSQKSGQVSERHKSQVLQTLAQEGAENVADGSG